MATYTITRWARPFTQEDESGSAYRRNSNLRMVQAKVN